MRVPQQPVRSGVAATPRVGIRGECAGEKELAAREFVSDLRELVVPILSAHAQRMLPDDPREVVDALENLIVDGEWAAGRIAGRAQAVTHGDVGDAPGILVRNLQRHADLRIHILNARQLLSNDVVQRVVAKTSFIHFGGREDPGVGEHPLAGPGV